MQYKVSEIVADFLIEKNIKHVFGIIGSGNANIFDAIIRRGKTEIICVHHEQAAVMAAIAYYRITGTITCAIVTTGAGSTNAITGVVSAWMDSIPVIILSGNENSKFTNDNNHLRIWGIQGYDSSGMVKNVTKYESRLMNPLNIKEELYRSFYIAGSARPGPVWLDIPMNIQASIAEEESLTVFTQPAEQDSIKLSSRIILDLPDAIITILRELKEAKRPVIWLGHGIRLSGATSLVEPLLNFIESPALVSWAGIDIVDSAHPRVYGRAGIYGQRAANFVLQNCDFLLAIGTRLAIPQIGYDISELARDAKIAMVDIDQNELLKLNDRIKYPICANAADFISKVLDEFSSKRESTLSYSQWIEQCDIYKNKFPWIGPEHADLHGYINSYQFMDRISPYFKENQIIVTDMGTALLSGHQVLKLGKGQRLLTSTGLGEMGYGLPAAIGAAIADAGEVLCLNCDGGMMLNLQELQTIIHHKLPIKVIIFNNDGYLMIKHTQKSLFNGRYAGTDRKSGVTCPDYSKVAEAFGFPSFQIRSWEEFDEIFPKVQAETGPVICEVFMYPEQYFYPKLGLAPQKDGSIVSPPLEDLTPFIDRQLLKEMMITGVHPKSEKIGF